MSYDVVQLGKHASDMGPGWARVERPMPIMTVFPNVLMIRGRLVGARRDQPTLGPFVLQMLGALHRLSGSFVLVPPARFTR